MRGNTVKTMQAATIVGRNKKKKGEWWRVKYDKDGKIFSRKPDQIKLIQVGGDSLTNTTNKSWANVVGKALSSSGEDWVVTPNTRVDLFTDAIARLATGEPLSMVRVSMEFKRSATHIGQRLIEDHLKDMKDRLHQSDSSIGGIAGGEKTIRDHIMFKLANPAGEGSPYLNSYEYAQKATGADLRGATAVLKSIRRIEGADGGQSVGVAVVLQAVVDHLGYRIQAMTLLSIGEGSLKVGTANGCDTRPATDDEQNAKVAIIAAEMGLAKHQICVKGEEVAHMHMGCDVEVSFGCVLRVCYAQGRLHYTQLVC